MLDINYLFKRIEYLERSISVLLDSHQLKGIYLSKNTVEDIDNQYSKHKIREKMINFIRKKIDSKQSNQ